MIIKGVLFCTIVVFLCSCDNDIDRMVDSAIKQQEVKRYFRAVGNEQEKQKKKELYDNCEYIVNIIDTENILSLLSYHFDRNENNELSVEEQILDYKIIDTNEKMIQYRVNKVENSLNEYSIYDRHISSEEYEKLLKNYLLIYIKNFNKNDKGANIIILFALGAIQETLTFCNNDILKKNIKNHAVTSVCEQCHTYAPVRVCYETDEQVNKIASSPICCAVLP